MCLAIPGRIVEFRDEDRHLATVEVSGVKRTVNVDLLREEGLEREDWVLIHVGFAMSKISEEEAQEQLDFLEMMGEADAALDELEGYGSEGDPFEEDAFPDDGESTERGTDPPSTGRAPHENASDHQSTERHGAIDRTDGSP